MIICKEIQNPDEKTNITLKIMKALPEWFSPPEDVENKCKAHCDMTVFSAEFKGEIVGFISLKKRTEYAVEIFNLGVLKGFHGMGIGTALINKSVEFARKNNYKIMTVKTLDESANYPPYESTRKFYIKHKFYPLEVFENYWDKDNPCLFLARFLEEK